MFDAGSPQKSDSRGGEGKSGYFPTVCVLENHNCGFAETHVVESGKIALETSAFRSILTCLSGACEFSSLTRSRAILMTGPLLPPACVESGNKPPPVQRHGAISHTRRGVRRSAEARSPLGSAATEAPAPLGLARVPRPPAHARCPPRSPRPPPPSPSRPARGGSPGGIEKRVVASPPPPPPPRVAAATRSPPSPPRPRPRRRRRRTRTTRRRCAAPLPSSRSPLPPRRASAPDSRRVLGSFLPRALPAFLLTARPRRLSSPLSPPPRPRPISRR